MVDIAAAIFLGNVLTLAFAWALFQFHKHDYRAPWAAYGWFFLPLVVLVIVAVSTEKLPPHFDALVPQQSAETRQTPPAD